MATKWTAARREKFQATMRARRRNGNGGDLMGELIRRRNAHLEAAKKIQRVMALLSSTEI